MKHNSADNILTIFIPVFDEEEILARSVTRVHEYLSERGLGHEILVVDNGSGDRTAEIGRELAEKNPWLKFYRIEERGPGRAFKVGVRNASGGNIVTLDVDLSSELTFIDYAVTLLNYADMVVGSKTMGNQRRTFVRIVGSQLYILFTQWFFDLTISDFSIGSKAFRREAILPALDHLDGWTGHIFELCVYLKQRGRRIIQIGIDCNDTRKSHFSLIHEGFYRYRHLYRVWRKLREPGSWLRNVPSIRES